jgi:TP901 family phage tail tape measure protein/lambda family phage tail tape measure protein
MQDAIKAAVQTPFEEWSKALETLGSVRTARTQWQARLADIKQSTEAQRLEEVAVRAAETRANLLANNTRYRTAQINGGAASQQLSQEALLQNLRNPAYVSGREFAAAQGQRINNAASLRNYNDPDAVNEMVRLSLARQRANNRSQRALMDDPELAAETRSISSAKTMDRLTGDGGATLLKVQGILLLHYTLLNKIQSVFTNAAGAVVAFDNELKQLQAISASTNGEMEGLRKTILDVSTGTKFSATELTEAATAMAQAGLSAQDIGSALKGVSLLATATGTDLKTAVEIATTSMGVFKMRADEMPGIANQMTAALNLSKLSVEQVGVGFQYVANTAAEAGLTLTEVTAAMATMANQGIRSGSTMGTGMRQLLIDLQNPSEELTKRIHQLGLGMSDIDVRANGLSGVLQNLRNAGFTSADAFATIEVRAAAAFTALSRGQADLTSLTQGILEADGAAKANAVQMESLANKALQLGNVIVSLAASAAEPLMTALKGVVGGLTEVLGLIDPNSTALKVFGTVAASVATGGLVIWLGRLAVNLVSLPTLLGAARGAVLSFQIATSSATGASVALGSAMKAIPFLAIAGAIGGVITYMATYKSEADLAAAKNEKLAEAVNTAKAAVEDKKQSLDSLDQFLNTVIGRTEQLSRNEEELNRVILQARDRFGSLSSTIYDHIGTLGELVAKIREVRAELRGAALNDLQTFRETLTAQIEGLRTNVENAANQRALAPVLSAFGVRRGFQGRDVDTIMGQLPEGVRGNESIRRALEIVGGAGAETVTDDKGNSTYRVDLLDIQKIRQQIGEMKDLPEAQRKALQEALGGVASSRSRLTQTQNTLSSTDRQIRQEQYKGTPEYRRAEEIVSALRELNSTTPTFDKFKTEAERQQAAEEYKKRANPLQAEYAKLAETARGQGMSFDDLGIGADYSSVSGAFTTRMRQFGEDVRQNAIDLATAEVSAINRQVQQITTSLKGQASAKAARDAQADIGRLMDRELEIELKKNEQDVEKEFKNRPVDVRQRILSERNEAARFSNQQARASANNAVIDNTSREMQSFISAEQDRLRTLVQRKGRSGGTRGGSDEIAASRNKIEQMVRERGALEGWSSEVTEANVRRALGSSERSEYSANHSGSAPKRDPNRPWDVDDLDTKPNFSRQLSQINKEAETALNATELPIQARKAELEAARRNPNMFPQAYFDQRNEEINQMQIAADAAEVKIRETQLARLESLKTEAQNRLAEVEKRLADLGNPDEKLRTFKTEEERSDYRSSYTRAQREVEQRRQELEQIGTQSRQVTTDRNRAAATGAARTASGEQTTWDAFTVAGDDFKKKFGLDDSTSGFKEWGDNFTNVMSTMQQAAGGFFTDFVTGNMKASQAIKGFAKSVLTSVAQMAANKFAAQMIGLGISLIGSLGGAGANATVPADPAGLYTGVTATPLYNGGPVKRFAAGGKVQGTHLGRDSVKALLAPGEGVLNRRAMAIIGEEGLAALNRGQAVVEQARTRVRRYEGGSSPLGSTMQQPASSLVGAGTFAGINKAVGNIQGGLKPVPTRKPDEVNVFVMAPDQKPSLGPKDVLAIIGEDIATGGSTKKLIKQVTVGA